MADDWVFDFVLAVFETPAWTNPIDDFIDAHCGLFEGAESGSENKLEWTTVHRQFCEMIEANLEKRLEEVGLTPEQFVGVLEAAAKRSPENSTPRVVLEQLLAVEDFASFKRLMCKRRLEIEAETLRAIVAQAGDLIGKSDFHMAAANLGRSSRPVTSEDLAAALAALDLAALSGTGVASASPRGPSGAASAGGPPGETDVARAIRESLLEAEAARRLIDYERKMLEAAIAESLQISAADAARLVDMDGFWGSDVAAVVISATASSKSAAAASAAAPAAPAAALKPAVPAPAAAEPVAVAAAKAAAPEAAAAVVAPAAVALQPAAAARASEAACDPLAAVPAISAASPARNASATAAGVSASASVMEAAAVASPPRGVGAAASASVASPAGDAGSTGVSSSGGSSSMSGGSSMSGSSMSSLSALPPLGFASSPLNPLPRLPALSPTSARGAKGTLDALQLSAGLFADGGAGSSDDASRARVAPVPASDDPDASAAGGMSDADARAAAEVRARAAHWKRQREALLARKAEERARQLAEHERSAGRPAVDADKARQVKAAAQAAVAAVNAGAAGGAGAGAGASGSDADVRAAMRAAVMAKLRSEVP